MAKWVVELGQLAARAKRMASWVVELGQLVAKAS
jgi:hypothetical protein